MDHLDIITWNVYQGHDPADVLATLREFATKYRPHVIALQEATNLGPIHVPGYTTYHEPAEHTTGRVQPENADAAMLVRDDVKVTRHGLMRMTMFWNGPDHGLPHRPRVYHRALLRTGHGGPWKFGTGHWPFDAAQQETIRRIARWFRRTLPGRKTIWVGDLNAMPLSFREIIGIPGVRTAGHRIDRAIYRNCEVEATSLLGKHNSDHNAVLLRFRAKR